MVFEIVMLGFLAGWLLKGRIGRLGSVRIKYAWVVFVPFAMQWLAWPVSLIRPFSGIPWFFGLVQVTGYIMVMWMTIANWRVPGAKLIFAGLLANVIVIVANGGFMPVTREAVLAIGGQGALDSLINGPHLRHVLADAGTRLYYLSDILIGRHPYFLIPVTFSIGDTVTSLGAAVAVASLMRTPLPSEKQVVEVA